MVIRWEINLHGLVNLQRKSYDRFKLVEDLLKLVEDLLKLVEDLLKLVEDNGW